MRRSADEVVVQFSDIALPSGVERSIRGVEHVDGTRIVAITPRIDGRTFGRLSIFTPYGAVVLDAIEAARSGRCQTPPRSIARPSSEIDILVWPDVRNGAPRVYFGRVARRDGSTLGRPISLTGEELVALERALTWAQRSP
jgi:hypothetical protein